MATKRADGLDRDSIVSAAFAQLEAGGIDGLSMRELAARLGVQAPALYWHVANKAELIGLMAGRIHRDARSSVPSGEDWRVWLFQFGLTLKRRLLAHRDGAQLCAVARPVDPAPDAAAEIAAPLVALGLTEAQSISYQASVISLTLGWALFEANGPMHAFLADMMECDASYELGLRALIDGYNVKHSVAR